MQFWGFMKRERFPLRQLHLPDMRCLEASIGTMLIDRLRRCSNESFGTRSRVKKTNERERNSGRRFKHTCIREERKRRLLSKPFLQETAEVTYLGSKCLRFKKEIFR